MLEYKTVGGVEPPTQAIKQAC